MVNQICMITQSKNEIIDVVKYSQLYNQIKDDTISVPKKYLLTTDNLETISKLRINDDDEFISVLDKLRYWMIDDMPAEIFDYALKNRDRLSSTFDLEMFKDFYYEELNLLINSEHDKIIQKVIEADNKTLIKYLSNNGLIMNELSINDFINNKLFLEHKLTDFKNKLQLVEQAYIDMKKIHDEYVYENKSRTKRSKLLEYIETNKNKWSSKEAYIMN